MYRTLYSFNKGYRWYIYIYMSKADTIDIGQYFHTPSDVNDPQTYNIAIFQL